MSASADPKVIKHSAVIFTSQAEKSNNGISVVCLRPHARLFALCKPNLPARCRLTIECSLL